MAAKLAEQTHTRRRTRSASGALLGGRLFDADGNAMSPSHTRKGGMLYRYYVSQALLRGRAGRAAEDAGPGRVAAAALEEAVLAAVRKALGWETGSVAATRGAPGITDTHIACVGDPSACDAAAPVLIEHWVERVVVRTDALAITLRMCAGSDMDDREDAATEEVVVPWSPRRRSSRAAMIAPEADAAGPGRARQPLPEDVRRHLLVSIARARAWAEALSSGRAADTTELAAQAGCSERQVRLLLPLAGLAPNLVQAAVEGRLASGYGAARLCRGLPAAWAEQRQLVPLIAGALA